MKNLLTLAVALVAAALVSTGCSTCCKKDAAGTKPATAAACTNHFSGFAFTTAECTNKPGALLVDCPKGCTNKFSLNLADCPKGCTNKLNVAECTKGGCTNKLVLDLAACPGDCTNKFSAFLAECTKGGCTNKFSLSFALGTVECTNKSSGLKI
jgi:hypothetical protein